MKNLSRSVEETGQIAQNFLQNLKKKDNKNNAIIVGLFGDLGSGKTAFTQELAKALGVSESVTSPTFVIEKIYDVKVLTRLGGRAAKSRQIEKLIHIDAYRLQSGEELMKLNFEEIAKDPKNLILIEWPENVINALPENIGKIYFKFVDEKTREVVISD